MATFFITKNGAIFCAASFCQLSIIHCQLDTRRILKQVQNDIVGIINFPLIPCNQRYALRMSERTG